MLASTCEDVTVVVAVFDAFEKIVVCGFGAFGKITFNGCDETILLLADVNGDADDAIIAIFVPLGPIKTKRCP